MAIACASVADIRPDSLVSCANSFTAEDESSKRRALLHLSTSSQAAVCFTTTRLKHVDIPFFKVSD